MMLPITVISSRDQTPEVRVTAQADITRNRTIKGVSPFSQDEVAMGGGETGGRGGGAGGAAGGAAGGGGEGSEVEEMEIEPEISIGVGMDVQDVEIDIIPVNTSRLTVNALTAEKKQPPIPRVVKGTI